LHSNFHPQTLKLGKSPANLIQPEVQVRLFCLQLANHRLGSVQGLHTPTNW
jgi:hypothetical protein